MRTWGKKNLKFLAPLLFIVALFGAFLLSSSIAHAQLTDPPEDGTLFGPCTTQNGEAGTYMYGAGGELECVSEGYTEPNSTATTPPPKGAVKPPAFVCIESTANVPTSLNILGCLSNIVFLALNIFAGLLGMAGVLLDMAIRFSTTSMSSFVGAIPGITVAWTVLRDLSNILILFILLFSALGIILRTDKIVPKSVLAKVIIAAFLINFSMFFTKVIIDIGNVATQQIYKETTQGNLIGSGSNLGLVFVSGLNPMNIYLKALNNTDIDPAKLETHVFQQMLFGTIIMMIATFTFFVAAAMLFNRFFVLIMLIVTSPIGVVGLLIPQLSGRAKEWWSTLFGQVFFAPIFLLFLLIAVKIIRDPAFNSGLVSAGVDGTRGIFNLFDFSGGIIGLIQYLFVISIILTGLATAKSVAGKVSVGITKWAGKKAGSVAFGGIALAGSYGIGRLGKGLAESQFANKMMQSENMGTHIIGRTLVDSGKFIGNASWDPRGVKALSGLDAGKAAPGFLKREEEAKKRRIEASKKVMPEDTTRPERGGLELQLKGKLDQVADLDKKLAEARALENSGLTGFALHTARDKKTQLEVARDEAKQKLNADPNYTRLTELEKLSVDVAKKREEEAKSQIAQLADVLRTHEMQQAREIVKAINENKEGPEKRQELLNSLNKSQQDFVQALEKLSGAQKQLGDIQKAGQLAWADKNIKAGGSVGQASEAIRKEHSKTKAAKILEELLEKDGKKDETPKPETPPPATP